MSYIDQLALRYAGAFAGEQADDPIFVKQETLSAPNIDMDQRVVSGMVTTTTVGNMPLIAPGPAIDTTRFWGNETIGKAGTRSVFFNHKHEDLPVGKCITIQAKDDGLWTRTYITRTGIGNDLLTLIQEGCLRGLSIGMKCHEVREPTREDVTRYRIINPDAMVLVRATMLEYSIVGLPDVPDTLLDRMLTRSLISRPGAVYFGLKTTPEREVWPTHITTEMDGAIVSEV
jgi:HK97 family phage prohead protease